MLFGSNRRCCSTVIDLKNIFLERSRVKVFTPTLTLNLMGRPSFPFLLELFSEYDLSSHWITSGGHCSSLPCVNISNSTFFRFAIISPQVVSRLMKWKRSNHTYTAVNTTICKQTALKGTRIYNIGIKS